MRRFWFVQFTSAFMVFSAAELAAGQQVSAMIPVGQSRGSVANSDYMVTVDLRNVTLASAIETLASRAGLKAVYADNKIPKKFVTLKVDNVPVTEAAARLLKGTGLIAKIDPAGLLKIVDVAAGSQSGKLQGIIVGKITDARSGKGIEGVNVSVSAGSGVTSDQDGSYRLAGVSAGSHLVSVRLVGYAKQTRSVSVGDGAIITIDFKLEPSANVLDQVVVTGTVARTELRAVPNAITVVTAKQLEERGITRIDQLFRGDIPGLFAQNVGSGALLDEVTMFSRGATAFSALSVGVDPNVDRTNPIKTYIDGVELADPKYLSQIDPKIIERIEILTGPQASTIYGSNAINGVMQIFTKRGTSHRPQINLALLSGWVENDFSNAHTPQHDYSLQINGIEGRLSYNFGGSWNYIGPWTPAKQSSRLGAGGGARLDLSSTAGQVTADMTVRRTLTRNLQRGDAQQRFTGYRESGWYRNLSTSGLAAPTTHTFTGQTTGITLSYTPIPWWSHELGWGSDASDSEQQRTARGYTSTSDTTLLLYQPHSDRSSIRYTTTARIPIGSSSTSQAQLTVTGGADAWKSMTSYRYVEPQALTGSLTGTTEVSRRPSHNTGGFLQSQLGLRDRLFITYGLRAEWNPDYGADAQPNIAPRYGVAYTHELGYVTAKLRGSYGRSTRPPAPKLKVGRTIAEDYGSGWSSGSARVLPYYGGIFDYYFANPDLGPEHQQGGEGGVELYLGTRGSLVVTRYNQTVNNLIDQPKVDSIRSLIMCASLTPTCNSSRVDDEGYGYYYQYQYLNVASIRNQGWELQGSLNMGPLTTRGTYTWSKSRTIGVTPKHRSVLTAAKYQPGATFQYLPEHTWAMGMTYARRSSSIALNVTGIGRVTKIRDDFFFQYLETNIRLPQNRFNVNSAIPYVNFNAGYATADINASHRFASAMEGVFQLQNLADRYTNDRSAAYASIGRQAKLGVRMRW